ncbi:MAG TPA: glycosyltransferase family 39 protein [Candidatus Sulfotelmatobacter sp.]|jgi:4-amino-4-deoxy-L-arabinose transferase-like glycosyltransferase|nr:glycosyltransferase family 39 protein [Candidatus Sulfotelmatobacter sp.]
MESGKGTSAAEHSSSWGNVWTRIRTSSFWIVAIALLLRVGWIAIAHTYRFKTSDNNFGFGWEMGRIGASLASGHGFSSPFGPATGSTAWEPPLYPYLTAGVFRIFGIYSKASAFVLLTINSVFSALTCVPIFLTARRIFSEKVAVGSAWAWALLPNVMFWSTRWVWETSLSALLLTTIFWLALTLEDRDGLLGWFRFGLLWGVAALTSTSLLSFLPAAGLWAWYHRAKRGKKSIAGIVLASVVFFFCVTPWLVRNYKTFGQFIFIRDNFGAELRLGNGPGADGTWMEYLHPTQDVYAMRRYQAMGELAYIAMRKQQAIDYIKADYRRFAFLCVKRFIYFWAGPPKATQPWWMNDVKNSLFLGSSVLMFWGLGRALRLRKPGAWLLCGLILLYPAIYYVVFPAPRYRVPIEPEMAILAVWLLTEAEKPRLRY